MYSIRLRWDTYTRSAESPCPNDFIPAVSSFQKLKRILIILLASWGFLESAILLPKVTGSNMIQELLRDRTSSSYETNTITNQGKLMSWWNKHPPQTSGSRAGRSNLPHLDQWNPKKPQSPGWGTFQIVCLFVSCLYSLLPFCRVHCLLGKFLHLTKKGKQHRIHFKVICWCTALPQGVHIPASWSLLECSCRCNHMIWMKQFFGTSESFTPNSWCFMVLHKCGHGRYPPTVMIEARITYETWDPPCLYCIHKRQCRKEWSTQIFRGMHQECGTIAQLVIHHIHRQCSSMLFPQATSP